MILLTYDAPHRKTQDVALRLLAAGHVFSVLAVPWEQRKPRRFIYPHRPAEPGWPCEPMDDFSWRALGIRCDVVSKQALAQTIHDAVPEMVIVGGAGILPEEIVNRHRVLNVHPGLLPQCRGLDALKWAIIDTKRVGVTAHICDEHADLGWRVMELRVPVYQEDTFHSFAMRQYEYEVDLFPDAIRAASSIPLGHFNRIEPDDHSIVHRRMPRKIEAGLLEAFERYKRVYCDPEDRPLPLGRTDQLVAAGQH